MQKKTSRRDRETLARVVTSGACILLLTGILCLTVYAVYYARQTLHADGNFELREVQYRGVTHLDQSALTRFIRQVCPTNILAIDLDHVREMIEADAWTKQAFVRRKLPDKLLIHITERVPAAVAAIDNRLYVVDEEGVVLDGFGPEYQSLDRPIVKGLSNVARENASQKNAQRIQVYLAVIRELESPPGDYTHAISEIDVANPEKVAVFPADEPVAVYLGRDRFRQRYEAYLSQKQLYYRLKEKYGLIEYIDVSYENKVIFHTPEDRVPG